MGFRNLFDTTRWIVWNLTVKLEMMRDREDKLDDYTRLVRALHRRLRIPRDYSRRGLPIYRQATDLVAVPAGQNGQTRLMTPGTRSGWLAMQSAAAADGIRLSVRWAFRDVGDQARLILDNLSSADGIEQLLTWMAAPGHSEHHTGRALDIDFDFHEKVTENTPAFDWLSRNGPRFGFHLSYPQDKSDGLMFEPWHWCYRADA